MPDSIDYAYNCAPQPGETREVAPGVHWLRMPLPFRLDHINIWLLEDGEGWALVDTGIFNAASVEIWEGLLRDRLGGRPLTRVLVTHFHPDHMGMAGWLVEKTGAELSMTQAEWLWARSLGLDCDPMLVTQAVDFYRRCGCSDEMLAHTQDSGVRYPPLVSSVPRIYRRMRDGDTIEVGAHAWRVVVGTGHAPEHACLYCPEIGVMISGDQVLPRITPVISVHSWEPEANPLQDFMDSIEKLRALPADTYVLPSHNLPFYGLGARLTTLRVHHEDRLGDLLGGCAEPATAMDLVGALFRRPLDLRNMSLAVSETLAHANLLIRQGQVARETGADGVWRYRRT